MDGGSFAETTLRANADDFGRYRFRQKVLANVGDRSLETTILGLPSSMPLVIAPTALSGIMVPGGVGEIEAARAAKKAAIPYTLGVLSLASLEEVRDAIKVPFWLQTKPLRDRGFMRSLFDRALAAGCPALVVTVDGQVLSQHYRGVRNGFGNPRAVRLDNFHEFACRPGWSLASVMRGTRLRLGNLQGGGVPKGFWEAMGWVSGQLDPAMEWRDLAWFRDNWPGKLVIKGVLDPQDAQEAVAIGADAISVSNHGGNQLDGAPSTIAALPKIVEAVKGRIEVFLDGGVRSGQDVVKALALGARACLIGRAHLYGLAAQGEKGVSAILEMLRREIDVTMALTGVRTIKDISPDILWRPD
jgi:L-lactate dehydrogenase (cytochrome)